MIHRLPPIDRDPEIGDLCHISGRGNEPRKFLRKHGPGIIVKKLRASADRPFHYEIKWLKSEEHMRFFKDDIIVLSNVD